ncbi:MAG: DUF424 family protein [Candidatus Bathyarchaeia archaeon]
MAVFVKTVKSGKEVIVAACDSELLGKTLMRGNNKFHINPDFYGDRLLSIEEAAVEVCSGTNVNLVGKRIVARAIELGLVHPEGIIYISGIPHALIIRI